MRILDLAFKDLLQILRDKKSLIFLLAMPLVFTLFMGFAYRGAAKPADPRLALGWINQDPDGVMSHQLKTWLEESSSLKLVSFTPEETAAARRQVSSGKLQGLLIVPPDFSTGGLAGESAQLRLVVDAASVTGQNLLQLVRVPVTRLMSSAEISRLSAANTPQTQLIDAFNTAVDNWQPALANSPQLVIEKAAGEVASEAAFGGNPYNQSSPGMLVMFAIFGLVTSAGILVEERKTRTLQRMLTTAMPRGGIIAGHLLAQFVLVFAQEMLLVVFGQWVLGVNYFREPLGTLLVGAALALWVASLGLFVGVLAKSDDQVVLFSLIAMFLFCALGGTWFPLEGTGRVFAAVGGITPSAFAMTGFQNILIRGQGVAEILQPSLALLAYALGFFILSIWRFRTD